MSVVVDVVNYLERGENYNVTLNKTFDDDHSTYGTPCPRPPKKNK